MNRGIEIHNNPSFVDRETNHLLVISIDDYKHFPCLNNAVRDGDSLIEVLSSKYDFESDNIVKLYNQKATKSNIIRELFELRDKPLTERDSLVIYFSGHGIANKQKYGYWIPYDGEKDDEATYISNETIVSCIRQINTLHTVLISDSCFSGTFFKTYRGNFQEKIRNRKSRWAITSGQDNEIVLDGEFQSPFSESFLRYLEENTEDKLSISELSNYVKIAVSNNNFQTPMGGVLFNTGDDGGEYVFRLKDDYLSAWEKASQKNTIESFSDYLNKFPDSEFAKLAEEKIEVIVKGRESWKENIEQIIKYLEDYIEKNHQSQFSEIAREKVGEFEEFYNSIVKEEKEDSIWENILEENNYDGYKEYLDIYPKGKYSSIAELRLKNLKRKKEDEESWLEVKEKMKSERSPEKKLYLFTHYRFKHPKGDFTEEANKAIEEIQHYIKVEEENTVEVYKRYLDHYTKPIFESRAKNRIKKLQDEEQIEHIIEKSSITELDKLIESTDDEELIIKAKEYRVRLIQIDEEHYQKAIEIGTAAAFHEYLENNPEGLHYDQIRKRLDSLDYEFYKSASDSNDKRVLEEYIEQFPDGIFLNDVRSQIKKIDEENAKEAHIDKPLNLNQQEKEALPSHSSIISNDEDSDNIKEETIGESELPASENNEEKETSGEIDEKEDSDLKKIAEDLKKKEENDNSQAHKGYKEMVELLKNGNYSARLRADDLEKSYYFLGCFQNHYNKPLRTYQKIANW